MRFVALVPVQRHARLRILACCARLLLCLYARGVLLDYPRAIIHITRIILVFYRMLALRLKP